MKKITFAFEGIDTIIQCNKEDKIEDICNKYANQKGIDIDSIYFLYNGMKLDLELPSNNIIDKNENNLKILVFDKTEKTIILNKGIIKSKDIICPECQENCKIKMNDYKIKLYDCKNNHEIYNIFLNEFNTTQNIDELNIICDVCKNNNKCKSFNKKFYVCFICEKNICPLCKKKHDKSHKLIDYERKNYICNDHNETFKSYCNECNINLCLQCEIDHNNHEIINYRNILPDENKIKEELKEFRNKIDKFNNKIDNIIKILNKIKDNFEIYYNINNEILNNYTKENINYEILYNINEIRNNIKIKDIDEIINDNNINNEFKKILNIYNKMIINDNLTIIKNENKIIKNNNKNEENKDIYKKNNNDEITIIYKINKEDTKIKLFGEGFIKNNKDKCKYIYEDKEYELEEYFKLSNYNKDKLEIKLKGINNITNIITNIRDMFYECSSLSSLPDIFNWNTSNVTNMSFMFSNCYSLSSIPDFSKWNTNNVTNMCGMFIWCKSLLSLPDISKWNTNNVTNMCFMFCSCKSLSSLPDISKWNTNNVTDMNNMFNNCSSLSLLPDISKWNTNNVTNMSMMFYNCSSLSSLPDISKWNTNNVTNMSDMFSGCRDSLNIPLKFKK